MKNHPFSLDEIREYVEVRRSKQGISHVRQLLERFWMENQESILATVGTVRQSVISVFRENGLNKIADKILKEWNRENDPEFIASHLTDLPDALQQILCIDELLRSRGFGINENTPLQLLRIARETQFREVTEHIARFMDAHRHEVPYLQYTSQINRLLMISTLEDYAPEDGIEYPSLGVYIEEIEEEEEEEGDGSQPQPLDYAAWHEEVDQYNLEQERAARYQAFRQQWNTEEAAHNKREIKRSRRNAKQGRPFTPRPFVPSSFLRSMEMDFVDPEDREYDDQYADSADDHFYNDDLEDQYPALDLEDFRGVLPPETGPEYKARTRKKNIQSLGRYGADRQRTSKFKARRRRLDDQRREEKSYGSI